MKSPRARRRRGCGGASAGVGLREDADPAWFEGAGYGKAVISGTVIDNNDLGARMRLQEGGLKRGREPARGVVRGN
jgi:hypothetical protein